MIQAAVFTNYLLFYFDVCESRYLIFCVMLRLFMASPVASHTSSVKHYSAQKHLMKQVRSVQNGAGAK
jgi:hypothetical protein